MNFSIVKINNYLSVEKKILPQFTKIITWAL